MTSSAAPYKKLRRPTDDRMVAGVCSGIARYLGADPVVVRVGFVVLALITGGAALIAYPLMWIIVPDETAPVTPVYREPGDQAWNQPPTV